MYQTAKPSFSIGIDHILGESSSLRPMWACSVCVHLLLGLACGTRLHRFYQNKLPAYFVVKSWSERQDLNLRPPHPQRGALPDCATFRLTHSLPELPQKIKQPFTPAPSLPQFGARCANPAGRALLLVGFAVNTPGDTTASPG